MDERVESEAATVDSCSPGATPQSFFSYPLHLSPPGLALMYFSEHVWGANCLLGRGRSDYELLRASGHWVHNLGALQSVEMREMKEDEEESAADCWLGGRVGGPIRWRKPGGWRLCGKKSIVNGWVKGRRSGGCLVATWRSWRRQQEQVHEVGGWSENGKMGIGEQRVWLQRIREPGLGSEMGLRGGGLNLFRTI